MSCSALGLPPCLEFLTAETVLCNALGAEGCVLYCPRAGAMPCAAVVLCPAL